MLQDLRFALRILRRNPAFSAAAILIVALGIAATCVIFSFAEAAVFRALPYRNPSRLVDVTMTDVKTPERGGYVSVPVFLNWLGHEKGTGHFAASFEMSQTLVGGAEPMQVYGYSMSEGAFRILGVRPILGRDFLTRDYIASASPVVILSYPLWQSLFNGRSDVLGRQVVLDGVGRTVVGVMPPGFLTPESGSIPSSYWTPLIFNAKQRSETHNRSLYVWGRLSAGVSTQEAEAALGAQAKQVVTPPGAKPTTGWRIDVSPLAHEVVKQWHSILILLLSAVGLLLAIACVNVANLLLARANSRQKEIAVRVAVGASRLRVVRQLLTESAVLGALGGGLGIVLARSGIRLEFRFLPAWLDTANFQRMGIDPSVLLLTLAVSVAVGIMFGMAPALHASKINLVESLKEAGASATSGRGRVRIQNVFVVAEMALSLMLLMGAGLLLRSFLKLQGIHLGFNPREVLTMRVFLPKYQYPQKDQQIVAYQHLLEKVKALPGVQSSAFAVPLPLGGIMTTLSIPRQPGMANLHGSERLECGVDMVSAGYFETMDIPLLGGRTFTLQDTQDSEPVAIVNEAFARRYWPGENPVGKEIFWDYPRPTPVVRIVGVVGNVWNSSLWGPPRALLYRPYTQFLFAAFIGSLIAKTRTPGSTAVAMQKAIRSIDPEAPISQIRTMDEVLARGRAGNRFYLLLVGIFALLAVILAAAGIASTVSYAVSERRHEIGIRMALGAERGAILRLMVGQILKVALVGIALGIGGSFLLTRFVASQLHGVKTTDPLTFVAVPLLLVIVCLLASLIPASRATRINPAETLRST